MKKNGTTLRKVFNPWNLQSGYPSLRSQSILSKRLTCKVFWNKELSSCLFFSAAGLTFVLTVPVCAFYCLGKGYASHHDNFAVENGGCPRFRRPAAAPEKACGASLRKGCPYASIDQPASLARSMVTEAFGRVADAVPSGRVFVTGSSLGSGWLFGPSDFHMYCSLPKVVMVMGPTRDFSAPSNASLMSCGLD